MVGAHPDCIAIGEARAYLRQPSRDAKCSCGKPAHACKFWCDVFEESELIAKAERLFPGKRVVTSDKSIDGDITMIRDVRGWAHSTGRRNLRGYLNWYSRYRSHTNLVSYERLVFDTEATLKEICNRLQLEPDLDAMLDYNGTEHHAIKVNRMKGDPRKMGRLVYDYEWMADSSLLYTLMPWVAHLNRAAVHRQ